MKAVVKEKTGPGITIEERDIPDPGPHDALIRIKSASICGTDLHIYEWDRWAENRIKPPVIIGHEFAGVIEDLGKEVTYLKAGDRVSGEGHITCGHCFFCRTGRGHICKDVRIIGVDRDGCFSEYLVIPAENLWPIPDCISDRLASLFDPLGNAMHTVMTAAVAEKSVLITGAGSIGLFTAAIAKTFGAAKILVTEPSALKRDCARQVGADKVYDSSDPDLEKKVLEQTEGLGPEILFEISGQAGALALGLKLLRGGGTAGILGIYSSDITLNWSDLVVFKGITVHGISGRLMYQTWYQSQNFLAGHGSLIEPILTHDLPFTEIERGFQYLKRGEGIKIILTFA